MFGVALLTDGGVLWHGGSGLGSGTGPGHDARITVSSAFQHSEQQYPWVVLFVSVVLLVASTELWSCLLCSS